MTKLEERKRKQELARAPKDLESAIQKMIRIAQSKDLIQFAKESEESPGAQFHFTSGMAMRNSWGLWEKNQPISQWFRGHGIWHADDMSALIYKALWCRLNSKLFDIDKEAKFYTEFWKESGLGFDGKKIKARPSGAAHFTVKVGGKPARVDVIKSRGNKPQ